MKKIIFLILTCIILIGMSSCKKEGCTDKNANNYNSEANKDDNSCSFSSDKFVGTYKTENSSGSEIDSYTCTITKTDYNRITLTNIVNRGKVITATVINDEYITIDPYDNLIYETSNFTNMTTAIHIISGYGILENNFLTLELTVEYNAYEDDILIEELSTEAEITLTYNKL